MKVLSITQYEMRYVQNSSIIKRFLGQKIPKFGQNILHEESSFYCYWGKRHAQFSNRFETC